MIGYPFDSQITFDEHGNPQYDRAISSKPLKELIRKLFTTGVMPNPSNNLQVVEGVSGLTTIVKAGFCIIEGGLKLEEEDKTMMHQAADTTYDRIDTVVMRWNDNDNARICSLYVVEGTPASTPVRPTLTREGSVYEIGLADVLIKANSTVISQQRITDTRYETERCGVISSISEFDTDTIYAQVQADLAGFKADEEAEFIDWFDYMKDQLSEDAAGNLQNQIGVLSNLETTNKDDLVGAVNEVKNAVDELNSEKADQSLIAPIQTSLVASKAYAVGEQFVYNGLLYRATASIASGGTITIDGNCELSPSLVEQIDSKWELIDSVSATGGTSGARNDKTVTADLSQYRELVVCLEQGGNIQDTTIITMDSNIGAYYCHYHSATNYTTNPWTSQIHAYAYYNSSTKRFGINIVYCYISATFSCRLYGRK